MINQDFRSLSDYRSDGRKKDELRDNRIRLGFDNKYDGSANFKIGLTEVEARVIGPIEVRSYHKKKRPDDPHAVEINYNIAPFSTMLHKEEMRHDKDWDDFAEGLRKTVEANLVMKADKNIRVKVILTVLMSNGCKRL